MSQFRPAPPQLPLLSLAVCLMLMAWHRPAKGAEEGAGYSTNANDQAQCKRQLNIIYGAIQQYREQRNGELPGKLSDLTPEFIHNADVLVCPYVNSRQGGLRTWKKRFRELTSDSHTSYSYEMPPEPLDLYQWRGLPMKTWRDFKKRQQDELGPVVPIVRCLDHRPCLNLAIGGNIFPSGEYWEKEFRVGEDLLTIANLFRVPPSARSAEFPPRAPEASSKLLDLTGSYNATLTNGWQGFTGNDLTAFPAGIQKLDGVEFDVRGVIQLQGTELPAVFPREVTGIKVGQKCRRIHFLHALSFAYQTNTTQAWYRFHYANEEVEEFRVLSGQHIADWWRELGNTNSLSHATVAWRGQNDASKAYGAVISLYHTVWENPRRESVINTITLDAGSKKYLAGPFILAITVE